MAELRRLGGKAVCSVCELSRARKRSAEGHGLLKIVSLSLRHFPLEKTLKLISGVHRSKVKT